MAREFRKTEKRLRAIFWEHIAGDIPRNDKPMLREAFNTWLDSLHRNGEISDYQVQNITLGKH